MKKAPNNALITTLAVVGTVIVAGALLVAIGWIVRAAAANWAW